MVQNDVLWRHCVDWSKGDKYRCTGGTAVIAAGSGTPEYSAITAEVGLRLIAAIVALCLSFPDHSSAVCKGGSTVHGEGHRGERNARQMILKFLLCCTWLIDSTKTQRVKQLCSLVSVLYPPVLLCTHLNDVDSQYRQVVLMVDCLSGVAVSVFPQLSARHPPVWCYYAHVSRALM